MSVNKMAAVNDVMKRAGVNYAFEEWRGAPVYPYWVGEYYEFENPNEDGQQEASFIVTGFTRGDRLELEIDLNKIRGAIGLAGYKTRTDNGSMVAVFYGNALANIPTGDAELKRTELNLTVKEWSGNNE